MTREHAKHLVQMMPLIAAYSEGKTIQAKFNNRPDSWGDQVMPEFTTVDGTLEYRIKPISSLRPWKPEEVPVGALYKWRNTVSVIISVVSDRLYFLKNGEITFNNLNCGVASSDSSYSIDGGKTWKPCGIMEGGE